MPQLIKYLDAHSHWSDLRSDISPDAVEAKMKACFEKNIHYFLQGGVSPAEWERQLQLKKMFPENFGLCFGLHPYFVSENEIEDCETALDQLAQLLPIATALGETGLDFRPHIMKDKETQQIEMFENQIELAKVFQKPMVLHVVQAHDKALQVLDVWGAPERKGFVHAFNGSFEVAKKYIDRGFLISIGGAVTFDKNSKLRDCVKKLPLEYLLIESDSPDQAPKDHQGPNLSSTIYNVAKTIAEIRNISLFDVLEVNTSNFKVLFRM